MQLDLAGLDCSRPEPGQGAAGVDTSFSSLPFGSGKDKAHMHTESELHLLHARQKKP
jgi:hypothetical protein